ncbi:uncharacterized protein N7473_010879 [Penicillium subrubescens]|uniref:Uncharacterized protein n=1 Tax=Penicillium subrubescens TaxID=1316194 RepID=A0A1Q5T2C6_9EURO|nr:uncharacterized protein N7473_010879 [Penicillium subrubescens]KAJ5883993.1 hypothetical protein N7473_010879 [Penicillium subrubescens]OKO94398.1 hypothetical protein PENSUB_11665 [Penicillium subrubescens]
MTKQTTQAQWQVDKLWVKVMLYSKVGEEGIRGSWGKWGRSRREAPMVQSVIRRHKRTAFVPSQGENPIHEALTGLFSAHQCQPCLPGALGSELSTIGAHKGIYVPDRRGKSEKRNDKIYSKTGFQPTGLVRS